MAKPFRQLYDKMSPEAKARVEARVQESQLELSLQQLRQQLTKLTQEDVAMLASGDAALRLSARASQ